MGVTGAKVRVLLSGMHSGPNPSPGLGVARSLRAGLGSVHITALDYSPASSGMHSSLIDDRIVLPSWTASSIETWASTIERLLDDESARYIPGLDLEARLLAERLSDHPRVLSPGQKAFTFVSKPARLVADELGVGLAPAEMDCTPAKVERFFRQHHGIIWVKGQHYEAFPVRSPIEARAAGDFVSRVWGGSWHLEAHMYGQECGLAFAARQGSLVDVAFMSKSLLTADGKTWAGQLEDVPRHVLEGLERIVSMSGWTGGGEVELLRTWGGELFVMELNPRFPAWVHGATVAGRNLPTGLVLGSAVIAAPGCDRAFTRVVEEIPLHPDLGHTPFRWSQDEALVEATKHPSGVRALARLQDVGTAPTPSLVPSEAAEGQRGFTAGLPSGAALLNTATPKRLVLHDVFSSAVRATFSSLAESGLQDRCTVAYSVKTCPDPIIMRRAAELGLVPEVISQDELAASVGAGMDGNRAILNGPAKWWPEPVEVTCHAFFADSLPELAAVGRRLTCGLRLETDVVGVRISPCGTPSRFGVRVSRESEAHALVEAITPIMRSLDRGWGAHFHCASSVIGVQRWMAELRAFLDTVELLSRRLGSPAVVDLGGGWHRDDGRLMVPALARVLETSSVASETELIIEPGKVLVEDAAFLLCRVLMRRDASDTSDLVVDAALGDLPEATYRNHPLSSFEAGAWKVAPAGTSRVLGRSCMETDVLAVGVDLRGVREGDYLLFHGCGAYDLSMSYDFGRGYARGVAP